MWNLLRRISLTQWILFSMVIGILIGWLWPEQSQNLRLISTVFLRLIKCIIVPLLVGTLVVGIAGHSDDLKAVGRLALKSIIYFEIVTTLALAVGLMAVNLAKPGIGVSLPTSKKTEAEAGRQAITFSGVVEHAVPKSFFEAAANNDVLQVVIFAILFAVAATQAPPKARATMLAFCEALSEVMFKFTNLVMKFAPFGIGAAIACTVGHSGLAVLINLGKLVLTLYLALLAFAVVVLWPVALLAKVPVRAFLRAVKEPALIAFSTTSSDAAMPQAIQRMVELGVPRRIVSFVLPTGYSFNLDGTTLYLALTSVFVAQAAGVHLTLGQQLVLMLTLMLTSKGVAGVPRASMVVLSGTLATFGLPLEGVALVMGVDELMDMARSTVNLVGNCLASAVMGRWEGAFACDQKNPPSGVQPEGGIKSENLSLD